MDFAEGFTLWRGLGVNYEFGVLEADARAAVHMAHRIGALIVLLVVGLLAVLGLGRAQGIQKTISLVMLVMLVVQISLGIINVLASLPLINAVAHNGVAALLLLSIIAYIYGEYKNI